MITENKISCIKSKEILKLVFSNLQTVRILKLIKYNKEIQNRLEISKDIFVNNSDLPRYEFVIKSKIVMAVVKKSMLFKNLTDRALDEGSFLINTLFNGIFLILSLIYAILLVSLDCFDESNTKENYDHDSLDIIEFLNKSLFILVGSIFLSYFLITFYACRQCRYNYGCQKYLKAIIIIFFMLLHLTFEALIIWKLVLSHDIKSVTTTWFIVLDYIFIILHFLYILLYFLIGSCVFFHYLGKNVEKKTETILISYNKIKIKEFKLPNGFSTYDKSRRKKYISENSVNFEYEITEEQNDLVKLINTYREKYEIPKYIFKKIPKIPKELLKIPSESIFFNYIHIFKINKNGFMIKYPVGEFKNHLINENEEILKIIAKDNLNNIHIINREPENEYIYIWESDEDNDLVKNELIDCDAEKQKIKGPYGIVFEDVNLKTHLLSE